MVSDFELRRHNTRISSLVPSKVSGTAAVCVCVCVFTICSCPFSCFNHPCPIAVPGVDSDGARSGVVTLERFVT